jgi:hypothetical protein
MDIPLQYSVPEHEAIRRLLEGVLTSAAAVELGAYPEHNALAHAVAELKRALHEHALRETSRAGRALDRLHDDEDAIAVQLRCALGLEDVLEQVGKLAHLLAEEEAILARGN